MIDPSRWFYCSLCECPAIKCEACGNISCSGGGCEVCYNDFEEAIDIVNRDEAPPKEKLRSNNAKEDLEKLFVL